MNKKRRGGLLLATFVFMIVSFMVLLGGAHFLNVQVELMNIRTGNLQKISSEITEAILHQIFLYSAKVNEFYRAETAEAKEAVKTSALSRWFGRGELDTKHTYTYEEIRERFGTAKFAAVDSKLSSTSLKIKAFDISILEEGRVYDENEFLVSCRVVIAITMDERAKLSPMLEGRTKYISGARTLNTSEMWRKDGVTITISMKSINGGGGNFWTE